MKSLMICIGNIIFRWRDTIFSLLIAPVFFLISLPAWPELTHGWCHLAAGGIAGQKIDLILHGTGASLLLAGMLVRMLTIGFAYIKRGGLNKRIFADSIVQGGMYGLVRNPMYSGNLLIVTGAIQVFNTWYTWALLPVFYFFYACIILAEENFLGRSFGRDYEQYRAAVPRLIPRLGAAWRTAFAGMHFNAQKVLNKEHGSFAVLSGGMVAYSALKLHFRYGFAWDSVLQGCLGLALLLILLCQILCVILKRAGRLEWNSV
ncbi:MAG: hypothetical protein KDK39_10090 [Leptospiraceae bacterium]|nr:hypothetical protein [Leptospiraceae bacterium]